METQSKSKWYQTSWAAILFLVFFFPVGLFLMWKYTKWPKVAKWVITGFFGLIIIVRVVSDSPETASKTTTQPTQPPQEQIQATAAPEAQATVAPANDTVVTTAPTQVKQVVKPTTAPATGGTVSQKNAVNKAKSYLAYTGFSRDGLVAQLEYDQFSKADAQYGADNAGGNWMNEAAEKAKSYMEYSAFSRGSLIDQLKYDKFTQEQAEHGASSVGL